MNLFQTAQVELARHVLAQHLIGIDISYLLHPLPCLDVAADSIVLDFQGISPLVVILLDASDDSFLELLLGVFICFQGVQQFIKALIQHLMVSSEPLMVLRESVVVHLHLLLFRFHLRVLRCRKLARALVRTQFQ
mmetsp:Transcript_26992/g.26058  ORF Transcript_26992/g.26058 Transcript_26992/m.26058 type:complete len:135 (+) Transcript_26992:52-456(+)